MHTFITLLKNMFNEVEAKRIFVQERCALFTLLQYRSLIVTCPNLGVGKAVRPLLGI